MAIDPSIPLAIRPVQIPPIQVMGPAQQFAQVLSLRNLMTQGQMANIQLQQAQIALQEQQAIADEWKRIYGTNPPASVVAPTPPVPGTAPVAPLTPTVPGTTPTAPLTPIAPTAPQIAGPPPDAFWMPQAAAPAIPGTTAIPQAAAPGAPDTTTIPQTAAPVAPTGIPGFTGAATGPSMIPPGMNFGRLLAVAPHLAPGIITNFVNMQKAQAEMDLKNIEASQKRGERLASIASSVHNAPDPAAAFPGGVMQAMSEGLFSQDQARAMLARGYNADEFQQFIDRGPSVQDAHAMARADAEARRKALTEGIATTARLMRTVNDQAGYNPVYANMDPVLQRIAGPTYTPQLGQTLQSLEFTGPELATQARLAPEAFMNQVQAAAQVLAPARARGDQAYTEALAKITDPAVRSVFEGAATALEVQQRAQKPQEAITTAETRRQHDVSAVSEAVRLNLEKQKFEAEYGANTVPFWVEQVYSNPDSVKDVPKHQLQAVGEGLKAKYGLPLPTPLSGSAVAAETAGRTTLENIDWIRNALQNPIIRANIGPIMGNLGNLQQATGSAVGLTPEAATLAQELRTRMRQFVFGEGRAQFGGRVPRGLMKDLEESAPRPNMDANLLEGALRGVEGNTKQILEDTDRQRFGGQARPPEARGFPSAVPAGVTQFLRGQKPGVYKLKNDATGEMQSWDLLPDGTVHPFHPDARPSPFK